MPELSEHHTPDTRSLFFKFTVVALVAGLGGGCVSFLFFPYFQTTFFPGVVPTVTPVEQHILDSEEGGVVKLIDKANPAVVSIVIEKDVKSLSSRNTFFNNIFDLLPPGFNDSGTSQPDTNSNNSSNAKGQLQQIGGGSGFIVSSDGLVVTNKHVVDDEDAVYTVVLSDGKKYSATVIAKDLTMDVALLKIESKDLPTLELGNSDNLKIGQTVLAIGYALAEYGNTVTKGVISGIGRRVEAGDGRGSTEVLEQAIQTDAAINPGNSGGPLLDLSGKVIGINTAVSQEGQSLGFAIPINSLKKTIEGVKKDGRIVRPWLGIRYIPITPRLAQVNNLPVTYGALVKSGGLDELAVIPGSPADKAGILENDILLEINEQKLEDKDSLAQVVGKYSIGDTIKIKVMSKGKEKTVTIKLEEMPLSVSSK